MLQTRRFRCRARRSQQRIWQAGGGGKYLETCWHTIHVVLCNHFIHHGLHDVLADVGTKSFPVPPSHLLIAASCVPTLSWGYSITKATHAALTTLMEEILAALYLADFDFEHG